MPNGRLPIVDATQLPQPWRALLRPGATLPDALGRPQRLPRFFFEVPSWDVARDVELAPNFHLWEFLNVDLREADLARTFPRYVPCAVALLAAHLAVFRHAVGTTVHLAANGGYRTPGHALVRYASPHCWGTAANIVRIGDTWLDTREAIEEAAARLKALLPAVHVRPYGHGPGETDDHLHVDLGYVEVCPHGFASGA